MAFRVHGDRVEHLGDHTSVVFVPKRPRAGGVVGRQGIGDTQARGLGDLELVHLVMRVVHALDAVDPRHVIERGKQGGEQRARFAHAVGAVGRLHIVG